MELKLSVKIGSTLQVRNEKGEWDWIKPEVGCEIILVDGEITENLQEQFSDMWDRVVGPQFKNVVSDLIEEPVADESSEEEEEAVEEEKPNTDEDDYY